mgnify:CR=1 FL=1
MRVQPPISARWRKASLSPPSAPPTRGVAKRMTRPCTPRSLSGGERRRVEIARALATEPKVILLDEPFAGVDPISISDIKAIINHLKERGLGVLITDHNVRETLDICERAYIVSEGQVIADGDAQSILDNTKVRKVYLGKDFRL